VALTQRHLATVLVEKRNGGPVCGGSTVHLRGRNHCCVDVEGEQVAARWHDPGDWQSLRVEHAGEEGAAAGGGGGQRGRLILHGDVVCLRAHTGRLLQLGEAQDDDESAHSLLARASCHAEAQRWEVLLA
jgi:hypothetical protein